jgi:hypothetical protein
MTIRPWEAQVNRVQAVTGGGQIVHDRLISIRRLKTVAGSNDAVGDVGYSGAEAGTTSPASEVVLYTDIACNISARTPGRTRSVTLPGSVVEKPIWIIQLPIWAVPQYAVRDRDILQDDEGYRYEVSAADYSSLGYHLSTVRLEA